MEHLSLEIFDRDGTGSKYARLPEDASITITDTSEIFASGDVWSHSFTLSIPANAHIFGSAGEIHGARLHEEINKRRARLWVEGLPLYLGYLKLGDEADVDEEGNIDVSFESGQKTFEELIEGTSARDVSVGDVVIGVALNRKRVIRTTSPYYEFTLDGLQAYALRDEELQGVDKLTFKYFDGGDYGVEKLSPYAQRWPKLVKSHGKVWTGAGIEENPDYTNVQLPYDAAHPFCNINICYPLKVKNLEEEVAGRGYTMRLAHGNQTTDGGDNQTRYNNAPNFYLLHFISRLFRDMGIHVEENQALDVEDLRRVFMLNYGCHYEEIENTTDYFDSPSHATPDDEGMLERYGQYYMPIYDVVNADGEVSEAYLSQYLLSGNPTPLDDVIGKVLLRDVTVLKSGDEKLKVGSVEGRVRLAGNRYDSNIPTNTFFSDLDIDTFQEGMRGAYSAYLAYATGDNYPNVEISEVIDAMKTMFGVRLLFNSDYTSVRIVLLRNIFRSAAVQDIECDIVAPDEKQENSIRGFRMTYGQGKDSIDFYYKGFNDLFPRASKIWKDKSDKHDYSQWKLDADYNDIKQSVSAMNKTCYVTPVNGNAFGIKVDEDEDVLYPSLFNIADFMDAEDGDCTGEDATIEEVQAGAKPVVMNDVNDTFASLFTGDLKAPSPEDITQGQRIATFARMTNGSSDVNLPGYKYETVGGLSQINIEEQSQFTVQGKLDVYISEGFTIRMKDNYGISNGGTPFDEIDPGLCFGVMRGSGSDAYIFYGNDLIENEAPLNDYWEQRPGSGAISHADSCDNYGKLWDYNGTEVDEVNPGNAEEELTKLFPASGRNAPLNTLTDGYIDGANIFYITGNDGITHRTMFALSYSKTGRTSQMSNDWGMYIYHLSQYPSDQIMAQDAIGYGGLKKLIIELDSSPDRCLTLLNLCKMAYGGQSGTIYIDNGVGSLYGRFSLKLRAEKLNPFFKEDQEEGPGNRRYLEISNTNLRGRGLCDQFYKEYSYWVRNARVVKRTVHIGLAQLLAIDKTVRASVGDVQGFIRKMQYTVSNKTGLGDVEMEIMYI